MPIKMVDRTPKILPPMSLLVKKYLSVATTAFVVERLFKTSRDIGT